MNIKRCAVLLLVLVALLAPAVRAQQWPMVFDFPNPVPCGSVAFDTLRMVESQGTVWTVMAVELLDSVAIRCDSAASLPMSLAAGDTLVIPLRFTPVRRGVAVDSIVVYLKDSSDTYDTVRIRMTGRGIGSQPLVSTTVLNFPRTATGSSLSQTFTLYNVGELPLLIDAASFPVSPPYRVGTLLPAVIAPGDSVVIEIFFEPTASGYFTSTSKVVGSCGTGLTMEFNGVTDLIGTGAVLRLTHAKFSTLNPDQIPCGAEQCGNLTIRNVGNAPLMIDSLVWVHNMGYSVTSSLPFPFFIAPNDDHTVQVCVTSMKRGFTRDTLIVGSNNRRSITFGMVIDASNSMNTNMECSGTPYRRIQQAKLQAQDFIARTLLHIPPLGIQDQLAVCSYTDSLDPVNGKIFNYINFIVPLTSITAATRTVAQDTVGQIIPIRGTPTGAALNRMLDTLALSPLHNRVIVLLTDGAAADEAMHPRDSIVAKAQALGVRIFTIGIGMDEYGRDYLLKLARQTGAESYDGSDCSSLQKAFEAITDIVSRGAKDYEAFELQITAPELVSTDTLRFDTLALGTQQCRVLTVTNIGEGDALLDSVQLLSLLGGTSSEFSLDPAATGLTFPITIPERLQVRLQICFRPDSIRVRKAQGVGSYFNCFGEPLDVVLSGVGTAEANIRIQDMSTVLKAMPGDIVSIPVYADSSLLPYDVDVVNFSVRWNKTMLDLRSVSPGAAVGSASIVSPVSFGAREGTVGIAVTGAPRVVGGGQVLAELQFQVLRGDSLGTAVELARGSFADGNPVALLSGAGTILFDSMCFRNSKPLVAFDPGAKVTVGTPGPQPVRSGTVLHVPVNADSPLQLGVALFAADGSLAVAPRIVDLNRGDGVVSVVLDRLPAGAYYLMVRLPSGTSEFRPVVVAQ